MIGRPRKRQPIGEYNNSGVGMSTWQMVGRVSCDPKLYYTRGHGMAIASWQIAVPPPIVHRNWNDIYFFDCIAYYVLAEKIAVNYGKGSQVAAHGFPIIQTWTDKFGVKRKIVKLHVKEIYAMRNPRPPAKAPVIYNKNKAFEREPGDEPFDRSYFEPGAADSDMGEPDMDFYSDPNNPFLDGAGKPIKKGDGDEKQK